MMYSTGISFIQQQNKMKLPPPFVLRSLGLRRLRTFLGAKASEGELAVPAVFTLPLLHRVVPVGLPELARDSVNAELVSPRPSFLFPEARRE